MPELIENHEDPRISKFLGLKGINSDETIIGEGFRVVEKMNTALNISTILTSPKTFENNAEYFKQFDCDILLADEKFIASHVGYKFHQGVFAMATHPGYQDLAEIRGETLILNNLDNAENVGALIRSATGLGFKNILIDQPTASPYLKRSIRVSMGNVFFANIYKVKSLEQTVLFLKERGYQVFSAANEGSAFDYREDIPNRTPDTAIVIGNEGNGIEESVKKISTGIIKIPVLNSVEHINAAAAGAILMSKFSPY